ncbi:MAG: hypothetical protein Q8L02_00370 [Candidatus Nitrotoga sp.]|nr:hypothetical protein [Candidatus Nitrotoga sp.]
MPISEEQRIQNNLTKLKPVSVEKLKQQQEIELRAIAKFHGNLAELESALGFLRMGLHYGWKVLAIIHSKKTFKKYEQILSISAREYFPEETLTSDRSVGYSLAKKLSKFWQIVNGEEKIEHKRESSPS